MHTDLSLIATTPATLLVAPGGYGKSYWIRHWTRQNEPELLLDASLNEGFSDAYFAELAASCRGLGLPEPLPERPGHWVQALGDKAFTLVLDGWENLESVERIQTFWQQVLQSPPVGLRLLLASRKLPRLPVDRLVAAGGSFFGLEQLSCSQAGCAALWQAEGLEWSAADQDFYTASAGWPLGMTLYLRYRKAELAESAFRQLLHQALMGWFPRFVQEGSSTGGHGLQTTALIWQHEVQARLRDWGCDSARWLPLHWELFAKTARSQPAYWLWQALSGEQQPERVRVLIDRCLSLQPAPGLHLSALTRLAHIASLQADWAGLDQALAQGEELLEDGQSVDVAAWHYLKANRARQCCRYAEAHATLDALLALPARQPAVMNFQVRARILRGLTAYQQGRYEVTRKAYSEALLLAEADANAQMQLELKLMLAFLDALLGQTEEPLPATIYAEVEALPLSAQPLVWLNLAFVQILGEHLDLARGQAILNKVRACAERLNWPSLEPMIADVEARLWRFHQDYDRAERLHQQALAGLETGTFDWLYASLNQALTLLRRRRIDQARPLLETVCAMAQTSGTLGLLREAAAALQSIAPDAAPALPVSPTSSPIPAPSGDEPLLEIQTFGSFQIRLDGRPIARWPRKRARHLLLQLLLHPHGLHRESLADWLTGSDDLEGALRSLDVHIHALRKLLEPERKGKQASRYIGFHDAVYGFRRDCRYRWDAESFAGYYQIWLHQRDSAPIEAEAAVNAALTLYTGPFLPELDFADEWLGERESYARRAGDLVLWSLEQFSRQGALAQAEDRAELLLKWDSLSEQGFAWLLRLAGQVGDRARLERLGERMESTFEKELGTAPPKELLQLYRSQLQSVS